MRIHNVRAAVLAISLALALAIPAFAQPTPATKAPPTAAQKRTPVPAARQYKTEAEAKTACAADTVVWVNTGSKIYHFSWAKTYGKTKRGYYGCEKEALAAGNRASKEKHKPAKKT